MARHWAEVGVYGPRSKITFSSERFKSHTCKKKNTFVLHLTQDAKNRPGTSSKFHRVTLKTNISRFSPSQTTVSSSSTTAKTLTKGQKECDGNTSVHDGRGTRCVNHRSADKRDGVGRRSDRAWRSCASAC